MKKKNIFVTHTYVHLNVSNRKKSPYMLLSFGPKFGCENILVWKEADGLFLMNNELNYNISIFSNVVRTKK